MSGEHDRYQFLLRQRLTSTALNAQSDYTARLAYMALQSMVGADAVQVGGVINGLLVTVQAGTMNVQIGEGLGLLYDPSFVLPDSRHRWLEVLPDAPLTAELDPGDGTPRWDSIELEATQVDGAPEVLDFYDPSLGVAVPLAASPVKKCVPTVIVRKGTPSASPKFPTGSGGRLPLAYVYVPAGAVALTETDVVYARPLRRPRPHELSPGTIDYYQNHAISGGGLITSAPLNAAIANDFYGFFERSAVPFYLPRGSAVGLSVNNFDGGGLPAADAVVYCYACPWPFPTGYDSTLCPREFAPRNAARFNNVATLQRNCFFIWSEVEPIFGVKGTPNAGGNASINHPNLGAVSLPYEDMIYIGAAFFDQGANELVPQAVNGRWIIPSRKTYAAFHNDLPIAAPATYNLWERLNVGSEMTLPNTATRVDVVGNFGFGAPGAFFIRFNDAWSGGAGNQTGEHRIVIQNDYDEIAVGCPSMILVTDTSGNITIEEARCENIDGSSQLIVRAYEDNILARR